jgi:type II secretory pathway pseudopilin PulG
VIASRARGFTLVEVVVALTILEVGLIGCVATLVLSSRLLREARVQHAATQLVAEVTDSLLAEGVAGGGARETEWGRVRWLAEAGGTGVLAEDSLGGVLVELWLP